jgi:hypothetical protein
MTVSILDDLEKSCHLANQINHLTANERSITGPDLPLASSFTEYLFYPKKATQYNQGTIIENLPNDSERVRYSVRLAYKTCYIPCATIFSNTLTVHQTECEHSSAKARKYTWSRLNPIARFEGLLVTEASIFQHELQPTCRSSISENLATSNAALFKRSFLQ